MKPFVAIGGFMGAGKTTVGALVAERLEMPFVDLDREVERAADRSVPELFREEGEAGFRRREADALDAVLSGQPAVVALGGGTLHFGNNLARLRSRARIVVLVASWDTLRERMAGGDGRPLVEDARRLWEERRAGYDAAGVRIETDGLSPEEVAARVVEVARCA